MRKLPAVRCLLADVFKDLGLLHFLCFLVAKSTATSSLFKLAIMAAHIQINEGRNLKAKGQSHLRQV